MRSNDLLNRVFNQTCLVEIITRSMRHDVIGHSRRDMGFTLVVESLFRESWKGWSSRRKVMRGAKFSRQH
jgi:hypothetical protein